jgi:imidazolonepropionase-like amidohydrolase
VAYDFLASHSEAVVRLAPDGTVASLDARGNRYKTMTSDSRTIPFAETFVRRGDHAAWKSDEEQGARDLPGAAFYFPRAPLPDALGWLVHALLRANGTLPIVQGGEAHLETTGELTVHADGEERRLIGYAISGIDVTPTRVWMNEDGSWFGHVSPLQTVVPDGWQSAVSAIVQKQKELDRERDSEIAKRTAHIPPQAGLAFVHARVLDVESGRFWADHTVVVKGDVIARLGPTSSTPVPAGAEVLDLRGKALLPGLWDMHTHLGDPDGVLDIAAGVTTVRDVGSIPDLLDESKSRYDGGSAVGPHVLRFGLIDGRSAGSSSFPVKAETEDEAIAAVDHYARRGYEGIKIYSSVKPEIASILIREAHARGMQVTGHVPVHMLAEEAVRAGFDGIEHINALLLNFFADHQTDTRTAVRFTLVGERAATFDLRTKPVADLLALLRQRRTVIDPTLGIFEILMCIDHGKVPADLESLLNRLPVQTQRWILQGGLPLKEGKRAMYLASFDKLLEMIKVLHEAKVPLVTGTDALGGLSLLHEIELFVRAGLSPADALRAATIEPARLMRLDKKSGSVASGKTADLVVVDGDPLSRIEDIERVVSTVRAGIVFSSAELFAFAGVRPAP